MQNINCRHGLNAEQEIRARKIKNKLQASDVETLQIFKKLFQEYIVQCTCSFMDYLKQKDIVMYSALAREMQRCGPEETYNKILNY